jgi:hypothetical protein
MKVKNHSGGFRQPSSWVLYELNMLFGFLVCDALADEEVESFTIKAFKQEKKKKYSVSTEFVQPLPVVPELVEAEYEEYDAQPRVAAPRRHRCKTLQDPPEEDVMDTFSCRPVVCQQEFTVKDDVDTVAAISPSRRVRKMHWADDEISCATGRVVYVQQPLV